MRHLVITVCLLSLCAGLGSFPSVTGAEVIKDPVTAGEPHATIGWSMGIRPEDEIISPRGRPFKIGNYSKPVHQVFASLRVS